MSDGQIDITADERTLITDDGLGNAERSPVAEALARIGVAVGAQRTELYLHRGDGAELVGWWAALGCEVPPPSPQRAIPLAWFPWTLGNIRQATHVFVRNAGPLPLRPDSSWRIRDLRMGSSVHLPITESGLLIGAVCGYWADERDDWPAEQAESIGDLARDLLRWL